MEGRRQLLESSILIICLISVCIIHKQRNVETVQNHSFLDSGEMY